MQLGHLQNLYEVFQFLPGTGFGLSAGLICSSRGISVSSLFLS
jgi:hypothetical protein